MDSSVGVNCSKVLQHILPICSYCRKIRDEKWSTVESYISQHTNSHFSHCICPDCMRTHVDADLRAADE